MPSPFKENFHPKFVIESVSDILDITNLDTEPDDWLLKSILKPDRDEPLGHSQSGVPRPFSHGIWFRGNQDITKPVIPSAYSLYEGDKIDAYDEKNAFFDLKLRMPNVDTKSHNSFELHCMMRHHGLPARLFDWSENPLIALYFAVSTIDEELCDEDGILTCLNAYRINKIGCVTESDSPGMFYPDSANVLIRSLMTEHTKLIDVIDRMSRILRSNDYEYDVRVRDFSDTLIDIEKMIKDKKLDYKNYNPSSLKKMAAVLKKLRYPVAVVPRRNNLRMAAQLSNFTIHGGKRFIGGLNTHSNESLEYQMKGKDEKGIVKLTENSEIFDPVTLDELNLEQLELSEKEIEKEEKTAKPFLIHFIIPKEKRLSIREELERLSINNASLYPELDYQAKYVENRWTKNKKDKVKRI